MQAETPQIDISRVLDAPRELVYRAFTDPDHFVTWWGPAGNSLPRTEIEFDVRPGGHQRWKEVSAAGGIRPFDTRVRVEFSDEADGRTRLTIRQWLPTDQTGDAGQGWLEALTKLGATLSRIQISPSRTGVQ